MLRVNQHWSHKCNDANSDQKNENEEPFDKSIVAPNQQLSRLLSLTGVAVEKVFLGNFNSEIRS